MSKKIFLKIITINFGLFFSFISLLILIIEIYARSQTYWNSPYKKSSFQNEKFLENAKKSKELRISIGDSFGIHGKGTDGNLLDNISKCYDKNNCSYMNLSNVASSPEDYFSSIKNALIQRKINNNFSEKIIISLYFGNDILDYGIQSINDFENGTCFKKTLSKKELVFNKYKAFLNNFLNNYFKSINIYRQIYRKIRYELNIKDKYINFYVEEASRLRRCLFPNEKNHIIKVKNNLKKINPSYIKDVITNKYTHTDLIIAIAYKEYFLDLYSLEAEWAKQGIERLKEEIINFQKYLKNNYPNSEVLYIGIPDKFLWKDNIENKILNDYNFIGISLNSMVKNNQETKLKYFKFTESIKEFFISRNINYIYLPSLLNKNDNVYDLFYPLDVHLNNYGNKLLSDYINENNILNNKNEPYKK